MFQTLDGMFAQSSSSEMKSAISSLMHTRMIGKSVRDYCLKMMAHLSQAEVMWTKLEQKSQIDITLESPPNHFSRLKMNKMDLTLAELMHELQIAE